MSQSKPKGMTDAQLDELEKQAKALIAIVEALRPLPEERRLPVFRAAAILSTGVDPMTERWGDGEP